MNKSAGIVIALLLAITTALSGMLVRSQAAVPGNERNLQADVQPKRETAKVATIITAGKVANKRGKNDNDDHFEIVFEKLEGKAAANWRAVPVKKYLTTQAHKLETNGAVIESYGPAGTTIEVIGIGEFKERFPDLVTANPKLASAAGFCSLMGGAGRYYCAKSTCTGSCTLHNIPVYCSCD